MSTTTPDFYDKLLAHYVRSWLVSGEGKQRTPLIDSLDSSFWQERVERLQKQGWIQPSDLSEDLQRCTKAELSPICDSAGVSSKGTKKAIVERLMSSADDALRDRIPGPFWSINDSFQQILDRDMERVWWLYGSRIHLVPRIDIIDFERRCETMSKTQWLDLLWSEYSMLKQRAAESLSHAKEKGSEEDARICRIHIEVIERRQYELLLTEGKDNLAEEMFPKLHEQLYDKICKEIRG